jgi:hypothetical protein
MIFETTTLSAVRRFVAHFNKKEKIKKTTRWTNLRAGMIFTTATLSARCEDM